MSWPSQGWAFDYREFFSKSENFYLTNPKMVGEFFIGLVDLKGNQKQAKANILRDAIGCPLGPDNQSNCLVEKYRVERKRQHLPQYVAVPVNWSKVEVIQRKRYTILQLTWRPALIDAQILHLSDYLNDLNVATESKDYQIPGDIQRVQFVPQFQRRIQVKLERKLAVSLLGLYENPPADLRDVIYFVGKGSRVTKNNGLASFHMFLKAKKIKVNHLMLPVLQTNRVKR